MASAASWWALMVAVALTAAAGCGEAAPTAAAEAAHEVLTAHGLPRGLLPAGIAAFSHDPATGRFEASLECPCTARAEVDLRYNATVAGEISYGNITALTGVSAQDLFLWFAVRGIRVDVPSSGVIYFDVGVVFKHFPLSFFEAPPPCVPTQLILLATHNKQVTTQPRWISFPVETRLSSSLLRSLVNCSLNSSVFCCAAERGRPIGGRRHGVAIIIMGRIPSSEPEAQF
jgi:hypothetical protein